MDRVKLFVLRNFEATVAIVLVAATALTVLVVVNKVAFLNFFYLPVLVSAYFLGKVKGVLTGIAAVLMVSLYAVLYPGLLGGNPIEIPLINIILWGAFLVITAYAIGTLYDMKEQSMRELQQAYHGILEILAKFIDVVDKNTKEHSERVSSLAVRVARQMELSDPEVENVRVAGLLHDVGKVDISIDVLRKASRLSEDEWEQVRSHAKKGSTMVKQVGGLLREVIPFIESHHEHFDGGGYYNMVKDDIPIGARILAVADAYDSMISDRPYRTGRPPQEATAEIENHSGTQFDPRVVEAFLSVVRAEAQYA